jgi:50S ribosomal subunit-associated GTPase HflX
MDKLDDPVLPKILRQAYKNSAFVSAMSDEDMVKLRRHVFKYFEENLVKATLEVAAEDQATLSLIYKACLILGTDFSVQDKAVFEVRATPAVLAKLSHHVVSVAD